MGRPKGSKNRTPRVLRRTQYQIRLSTIERGMQEAAARLQGLTWSEWARRVLRVASGLPESDPREKGPEIKKDTPPKKDG